MNVDKNRCFSVMLIICLVFLPILYFSVFVDSPLQINSTNNKEIQSNLKTSQVSEDFVVSSTLHKLIWIEGRLILYLKANESGQINCEFKDSQGGSFFTQINQIVDLIGNNETQKIQFTFKPLITTLPGNYYLTLDITGNYVYSENFEIILGFGYIVLFLVLIIFGISLIIILSKKKEIEDSKPISSPPEGSVLSQISEVNVGKISCPECKKIINEGLTFCPECGGRIPEFLRFNPNSPRQF